MINKKIFDPGECVLYKDDIFEYLKHRKEYYHRIIKRLYNVHNLREIENEYTLRCVGKGMSKFAEGDDEFHKLLRSLNIKPDEPLAERVKENIGIRVLENGNLF